MLAVLRVPAPASALPNTYDGVQLHSLWYDSWQTDTVRDLDKAKEVGSNVVRLDVGWQSLQPAKGEYSQWYVDRLDYFMAAARARGIKVLATLHLSPRWASSAPDSVKQSCTGDWWTRNVGLYPPTDPADYATAAAWVARRYAASLAALEIWNEPNDDRYLTSADNAADYVRLVKAAVPAVKAAAPGVAVLAGAIQYSDRPFLQQLYAKGMKGYYDGLSIHPYAPGIAPAASSGDTSHSFRDGINWIRQGQQAAGDSTPLWLTEFGWSTCSGNGACVSEAQQATLHGPGDGDPQGNVVRQGRDRLQPAREGLRRLQPGGQVGPRAARLLGQARLHGAAQRARRRQAAGDSVQRLGLGLRLAQRLGIRDRVGHELEARVGIEQRHDGQGNRTRPRLRRTSRSPA